MSMVRGLRQRKIKNKSLINKKILVTCGSTWVAIDQVRVISNISTGRLGHLITKELLQEGAKVTLLEGPGSEPFSAKPVTQKNFRFYDELATLLKKYLKKHFDVIIHAAAVADYRLKKKIGGKLDSDQRQLNLELIPTQKLINVFKKISPRSFLVGFKLESSWNSKKIKEKITGLFQNAQCDLVVANSLWPSYHAQIIDRDFQILNEAHSREALAKNLVKILKFEL